MSESSAPQPASTSQGNKRKPGPGPSCSSSPEQVDWDQLQELQQHYEGRGGYWILGFFNSDIDLHRYLKYSEKAFQFQVESTCLNLNWRTPVVTLSV